jgi:hypothetical protein
MIFLKPLCFSWWERMDSFYVYTVYIIIIILISVCTLLHHWVLFWMIWFHSTSSNNIFRRPILILSSCLRIGHRTDPFFHSFQVKFWYTFLSSLHILLMYSSLSCADEKLSEDYKLWCFSLCSFLSPLVPNDLLLVLFSSAMSPLRDKFHNREK